MMNTHLTLPTALLTVGALLAACHGPARADEPAIAYRLLDDRPKRIIYSATSHQGHQELQQLLNDGGYPHLVVEGQRAIRHWHKHPQAMATTPYAKALRPKNPDDHTVAWFQWDEIHWQKRTLKEMAAGKPRAEAERIATETELAVFQEIRQVLLEAGAKEVFFVSFHFSDHRRPNGIKGVPGIPPRAQFEPPNKRLKDPSAWMAQFNAGIGRTLAFDGQYMLKDYYPYLVGHDALHCEGIRLSAWARFAPMLQVIAAEEGVEFPVNVDLEAMHATNKAQRQKMKDVQIQGDLRLGGTATITWQADPSVQKVSIYLQEHGYRAADPYQAVSVSRRHQVAYNIDAAPGRFQWNIPATLAGLGHAGPHDGLPRRTHIEDPTDLRIMVLDHTDSPTRKHRTPRTNIFRYSPLFTLTTDPAPDAAAPATPEAAVDPDTSATGSARSPLRFERAAPAPTDGPAPHHAHPVFTWDRYGGLQPDESVGGGLEPGARTWFGRHRELVLAGDACAPDSKIAERIAAATGDTGTLAIEAVATAATTNGRGPALALPPLASLEQRGNRWILLTGNHQQEIAPVRPRHPQHLVLAVTGIDSGHPTVAAWVDGTAAPAAILAGKPASPAVVLGRLEDRAWHGTLESIAVATAMPGTAGISTRARAVADSLADRKPPAPLVIRGRLTSITRGAEAIYPRGLAGARYDVLEVIEGKYAPKAVQVYHWARLGFQPVPEFAARKVGQEHVLHLEPIEGHPFLKSIQRVDLDDYDLDLADHFDPGLATTP